MMRGIALFFFVCSLGYSAPPLQDVLRHAGKSLEVFWEQFSAINCTETVSQLKLAKGDKPAYRMESVYDYLVLMQAVDADVAVCRKNEGCPAADHQWLLDIVAHLPSILSE
jgi:hypothetical protein